MDYAAIKTEIAAAYDGISDPQIAALLMAKTVAGPDVDVPAGAVVGYLALQGKLTGLQKYVAAGAGDAPALTAAGELLTLLATTLPFARDPGETITADVVARARMSVGPS
jgi:hypothetical protein